MRHKTMLVGVGGVVLGLLLAAAGIVVAGSLNPGAGPGDAGSQMYTLQQIYDRINNGAAAAKMTAFTEPATGPGSTMVTLDALYDLAGQRSRPAKTGQTISSATGDDGDLEKGVVWPAPRFTDNNNGTVTDNLTGLIWLKKANCGGTKTWADALTFANSLYDGWTGDGSGGDCGLSDGSTAGQWRLPNVRELQSLIDYGRYAPALPSGHPFAGVESRDYWTSTMYAPNTSNAWQVHVGQGDVEYYSKTYTEYVWPVRGGQ